MVGLSEKHKPQHPHHLKVSPWGPMCVEQIFSLSSSSFITPSESPSPSPSPYTLVSVTESPSPGPLPSPYTLVSVTESPSPPPSPYTLVSVTESPSPGPPPSPYTLVSVTKFLCKHHQRMALGQGLQMWKSSSPVFRMIYHTLLRDVASHLFPFF